MDPVFLNKQAERDRNVRKPIFWFILPITTCKCPLDMYQQKKMFEDRMAIEPANYGLVIGFKGSGIQ
jgi:hypothetical protein